MKRVLALLVVVIVGFTSLASEITQTYQFSHPGLQKRLGHDVISFEQTMLTNRVGEPLLPYQSVSLLLPPGEEAVSVTIEKSGKVAIPGTFELYPAQSSKPLSETKVSPFQKNLAIYKSSIPYPYQEENRVITQYLNGFAFAFASFSPVEYIPAEGKLYYFTDVKVTIQTKTVADRTRAEANLKTSDEVLNTVKKLAQNPEMINMYPHKSRSAGDFELLIITPQSYVASFQPLVSMYLAKGDRSQVVTTEYINSNVSGTDLQMKIRNFIIQKYQENQINTVLLGGDVELVPYRGFYCYVQSGSGYTDNAIPADLYYAGLDGNWNSDGDTKWGEPGEDDLLPEIGVGRFPFSNATELNNLINKSLKYQTQPVLGEFTKPLLVGEHLYDDPITWGSDYLELLVGPRSDNGYFTNGIPSNYTIQTMYESNSNWSASDLRNAINQGKQYVHHVGHASQTYVAKMSNSDITNANFAQTNGVIRNFSIFHTHGCDCGSFDYNDCILEKMVTIENFAAAVIGNSRYGWFNEGQTEGPAAHLHREMTDAIFTDKIAALGPALSDAKIMTAPWVTAPGQWEDGALRWNFYDLNILGDPGLRVWSAEPVVPQVSYSSELILGTTETSATVSVGGLPMKDAVCSVLYNNQLIARALTDINGIANLQFDIPVTEIGNASLIVSGNNCLTQTLPLTFIPANGPYVVYSHHEINDQTGGNNNGLPDYNETIQLMMAMRNVGLETANNLTVTLSTDNPYITITNSVFTINQLNAGDTVSTVNAAGLTIAHGIPNQQLVTFQLTTTDGTNTWMSSFGFTVAAPQFQIGNYTINDQAGNNNGMLDAGETVQFVARLSNSGSSAGSVDFVLSSQSPWLTIENGTFTIDNIQPGQLIEHAFTMTVNSATPYGTVISLALNAIDGDYSVSENLLLSVGLRIEDFESGNFETYEWHHGGNANWTISMGNAFEGSFAAKSGVIDHSQQSDLWICLIVMGNDQIKFARKVSSEAGYDYLKFFIDDNEIDKWAGEIAWQEVSYPINEGSHVLRWSYVKDITVASGSDCAWVDKVTFPGTTTMIDLGEKLTSNQYLISPNPNAGKFYIISSDNRNFDVKIFDNKGFVAAQFFNVSGQNSLESHGLTPGLYVVEVNDGSKVYRSKMVVK